MVEIIKTTFGKVSRLLNMRLWKHILKYVETKAQRLVRVLLSMQEF